MPVQLFPDQAQFLDDLRAAFRAGHRRIVGVAPTGMGKTITGATMTSGAVAFGHRVLFAAGRRELITQTVAALARVGLTDVRIIQASRDDGRPDAPVIVGSIQTLSTDRWLGKLPAVQFGILDECQHGGAVTWADVVRSQPEARWVGLSATPERADGKPLGDLFDALVVGPSIRDLIAAGRLVPCRIWAGPATLKPGELALTPLEAYSRFCPGQRCAVFCRDRAHARAELDTFTAAGVPSAVIAGDMPDKARDVALAAWRAGDVLVAFSVNVLTEGFDLPELGAAILARRFNHAGAYLQAGGRIIRSAPGKSSSILIDLTGCAHEHGPLELERTYSLTGKAISSARSVESFGNCKECGSMFVYGPRACPHCGAEISTRPAAAPRSVNAGVAELAPARPHRPWVSSHLAKYDGNCSHCGGPFKRGTPVRSLSGVKNSTRHQRCPGVAA